MQVSDFLNHRVPPGTVLYSNFNYPVFAYYTNLPVHRLPESGPALYDALNRLPDDGILIAYRESDVIADPRLEWLDSNPHFRRFREFPSLVLCAVRVPRQRNRPASLLIIANGHPARSVLGAYWRLYLDRAMLTGGQFVPLGSPHRPPLRVD
jgi:hypothetical protein